MAEPWASIDDVAAHLGVTKISIYRWIEQRGLPATKIGKLWKLKISEVDAWMRERGSRGSAPPRRERAPRRTVLLIDDEPLVRDTLQDFLCDQGYGTITASDGEEALAILESATPRPDVIVLDLAMPGVDGWQFLERRAREPALASIPVVIVTASSGADVDGVPVLRKPVRLDQLDEAIGIAVGTEPAQVDR